MNILRTCLSLLTVIVVFTINAQKTYPRNYFRSPLDIPLYLSGTFGEPRSTHFHAGLDIKTQGVEGKNIYSIADGYISRVKASGWGYGNTISITHPNGYTSVYAHLSEFNEEITKWLKIKQIDLRSYEVELDSLSPTLFPVKSGDIVAKSGNTGGSHGPHLHFEIRDSLDSPINPFLFGFDIRVKDEIAPQLFNLVLYDLSDKKQLVDSKSISLSSKKTKLTNSNNHIKLQTTIKVNEGIIGFGIHTTDKFDDVRNNNGVYDIKMFFDDNKVYHYQMNKFTFENARDVLTHCDYWLKSKKNQSVHKCFVEPGNKLNSYNYLINNGYIYLYDDQEYSVRIEVSDFHENVSILSFKIQKDENCTFFHKKEYDFHEVLFHGKSNYFKNNDIEINMPEDALYDNMYFKVKKIERSSISDAFQIGDVKIPSYSWFDIKIKAKEIKEHLKEKYLMVYKSYSGRIRSLGGVLDTNNNTVSARSRAFGEYYISIDTIAPRIRSLSIEKGKNMSKYSKFQFKISDNLSGIASYDCFINGKWVVLSVDGKNYLYTYTKDETVTKGTNSIILIVTDKRNNTRKYNATFIN